MGKRMRKGVCERKSVKKCGRGPSARKIAKGIQVDIQDVCGSAPGHNQTESEDEL
jgi:hypothetical protein